MIAAASDPVPTCSFNYGLDPGIILINVTSYHGPIIRRCSDLRASSRAGNDHVETDYDSVINC
jgi:hypothetical protein